MHLTGYYRMGPSLSPLHRHILRNVSTLQASCVALLDGGPETIRFNAKHVTPRLMLVCCSMVGTSIKFFF